MLLFLIGVSVGIMFTTICTAFHEKPDPITRCHNCEVLEGMLDDLRND